jgi:hypothetical protein
VHIIPRKLVVGEIVAIISEILTALSAIIGLFEHE